MESPQKRTVDDRPEPISAHQEETWFLGSLISSKKGSSRDYQRISVLHNRITHEETNCNDRYQSNKRIATKLAEYFPQKWLLEITAIFRKMDNKSLGVKTYEDRVCSYLGYIEIFLTFRGLTLRCSILNEINTSLGINISKDNIRKRKMKILRLIPAIRNEWVRIREEMHQKAFISVLVQVINNELSLTECNRKDLFQIKQVAFKMAKEFVITSKGKHIKKPEVWARAICINAIKGFNSNYFGFPFPTLPSNMKKVIENKCWQLNQIIDF